MITGVSHATFAVCDLDASLEFWIGLLECHLRFRRGRTAYVSAGDLWIALVVDSPTWPSR